MRDRAQEEHRITEQAKSLHHKFYRIKMFALKPGAPTQPFESLREIMKSGTNPPKKTQKKEEETRR